MHDKREHLATTEIEENERAYVGVENRKLENKVTAYLHITLWIKFLSLEVVLDFYMNDVVNKSRFHSCSRVWLLHTCTSH